MFRRFNSSLPPTWDSSQLSRADPDGAPSSSASSPTSAPPGKMANRKNSIGSDEFQHRKRVSESRAQQQQQPVQQREYKDYRPKYYDWAPDSSSHLDVKQTTVHPKVVYDIPKSSHVFVDANIHTAKPANVISTPRSDNYRCVHLVFSLCINFPIFTPIFISFSIFHHFFGYFLIKFSTKTSKCKEFEFSRSCAQNFFNSFVVFPFLL